MQGWLSEAFHINGDCLQQSYDTARIYHAKVSSILALAKMDILLLEGDLSSNIFKKEQPQFYGSN